MQTLAFFQGFGVSAGLIIAIGAQNAYVLSCAIRQQHAWSVALVCMSLDALLILAGSWGLGRLIQDSPLLIQLATYGGAAFLIVYGYLAWQRAKQSQRLDTNAAPAVQSSALAAVGTVLALSLLNPHVYLDTVVLLGSIANQRPEPEQGSFVLGACLASVAWFSLLAWGGKKVAPWFNQARNWARLDRLIALMMWTIAATLLLKQ